jgi:transcriptional regulator with XRE-family HTH domain
MIKTLGERIRELREENDLSLRELSKKTNGLSAAFLSDIELGRRFPADDKLALIASAIGTTVESLKQFDCRPPIEEMKRLAAQNPALGMAFRKMVDMPPEEILKLFGEKSEEDDPK